MIGTESDTSRDPDRTSPERRTDAVRRRALAYVVDAIVLGGAVLRIVRKSARSRGRRIALGGVLLTLGGLLYHIVLEGAYGRTVGKRVLGIAVVMEDGSPCTYAAATVRTLSRFIDALPAAYLAAFVSISLTERGQRLGDLAAGTVVIRRARNRDGNRN